MSIERQYQVTGDIMMATGGGAAIAALVLAAATEMPDWVRSLLMSSVIVSLVIGVVLKIAAQLMIFVRRELAAFRVRTSVPLRAVETPLADQLSRYLANNHSDDELS